MVKYKDGKFFIYLLFIFFWLSATHIIRSLPGICL